MNPDPCALADELVFSFCSFLEPKSLCAASCTCLAWSASIAIFSPELEQAYSKIVQGRKWEESIQEKTKVLVARAANEPRGDARGPCAVSKPQREVPQVRQMARESGTMPQSAQLRCDDSWKS